MAVVTKLPIFMLCDRPSYLFCMGGRSQVGVPGSRSRGGRSEVGGGRSEVGGPRCGRCDKAADFYAL